MRIFFESIADNIMGKSDRCAIGACNNSRKYRDKQLILPHITAFDGNKELRFWKCSDVQLFPKWTAACYRKHFSFKKHHVICSKHFEFGRPTTVSPNPTLYLKGYYTNERSKRKAPKDRAVLPPKRCKTDNINIAEEQESKEVIAETEDQRQLCATNCVFTNENSTCTTVKPVMECVTAISLQSSSEVRVSTTSSIDKPIRTRMSWDLIKENSKMIKLYTGCPSAELFEFVVDHAQLKHQKLQYYKGKFCNKKVSNKPCKKPLSEKDRPIKVITTSRSNSDGTYKNSPRCSS